MKTKVKVCMLCLVLCGAPTMQAQSFLKKVGKAVEKAGNAVEKAADDLLGTGNSESKEQQGQQSSSNAVGNQSQAATPEAATPQEAKAAPVKLAQVATSLKGNVKSVKETNLWNGASTVNTYLFNENKQLTEAHLMTLNGNITIDATFEYNASGQVAKKTISQKQLRHEVGVQNEYRGTTIYEIPFDKDAPGLYIHGNSDTEVIEFTYDDAGNLSSERTIAGNSVTTRYYSKNGNLTRQEHKNEYISEVYTYDAQGNVIKHIQDGKEMQLYNDDDDYGEDWGEPVIKYDTKGRMISSNGDIGNTKWAYNAQGYIASVITSDRWWGEASTVYQGYAFDAQGNWTKRSVKMTGDYYGKTGFAYSTTREITYY